MKNNKPQKNIPDGWQRIRLGDIGQAIIGLTYSPENVVEDGGILVFRSSNIRGSRIDYADQVKVSISISKNIITREGDILICARNGSRRLIGKNAYINKEDAGNAFGAFMVVYRTKNSEYMHHLFQSYLFRKEIEKDLGPTINQVTTGNLNAFKFWIPTPVEQKNIVAILSVWDQAIEKLTKKIKIKKNIKKGLMQNLLTGKIRLSGFKDKWLSFEFSDCFHVQSKIRGEKKQDYLKEGLFPIIDQSQSRIAGYSNSQTLVVKTNLPFIIFGDHTRILKLIDFPFILGNDGTKVFQGKNGYDTKFLFYLLSGISVPNTGYNRHFKFLKELILEIPKSKEEQKAIADIIATADEEVMVLEKKLAILKEQKKYLLNNLITGQIRIQ